MPEILTFNDLRRFGQESLQESRSVMKSRKADGVNFSLLQNTVFVSYSSKDTEYVPAVITLLKNHGGNPYVDLGDERLPTTPSSETARLLKEAIVETRRLVVFVTTNSKDSKWVPWELGLADGAKTPNDIALLPAADSANETTWTEQEYLGLYRRIVWGKLDGHSKQLWMVYNHFRNTAVTLREWLT